MVTSYPGEESQQFTRFLFFVSGSPSFVRQLWGGGINRDMTEVFMSVVSRVRNFRGRHGYWRLVHQHRVEGVTTVATWVGIGASFGNPSMEAILSYGVPRTLKTVWDTTSKLKTRGEAASQEISVKDKNRDKESMYTGGFFSHKETLCFTEGMSVFTRSRQTRRELGAKELGQTYVQTEQVMERMKNYATRPSALPLLTYIPEKSLGQSCRHPKRFTRFIHLQNKYLQTKELGHWEHL